MNGVNVSECERHLAAVLLLAQSKLGIRVTQTIGVHGDQVAALDQRDAHDAAPQLRFPVEVGEARRLLLLDGANTQPRPKNGLIRSGRGGVKHACEAKGAVLLISSTQSSRFTQSLLCGHLCKL